MRSLALDPTFLYTLKPKSYIATFIGAAASMNIEDHQVWTSLAGYVSTILEDFDFRSISNICHSFYRVSHGKPVMLNFDDLFTEMELPII